MKTFVLLCTFVAVALGTSRHSKVELYAVRHNVRIPVVEYCLNKTEISIDTVWKMSNMAEEEINTPELKSAERSFGCFYTCLIQKAHRMKGSQIRLDKMLQHLDNRKFEIDVDAKIRKSLIMCHEMVKNVTDECEVALRFRRCVINLVLYH